MLLPPFALASAGAEAGGGGNDPPPICLAKQNPVDGQFSSGASDHDVVPAGARVLFERFGKNTDHTSDAEAGFTPWDLVEVAADQSGEQKLLHDPWIHWLPVADPTASFIAHVKTAGYAKLHLVSRDGATDHGRLLPRITRVNCVDWKQIGV